jgi:tetratricopeptide (TPR) repeat protein
LLTACSFLTGDDAGAARSAALWLGTAPHSIEALYWSVKANEQLADQALEHFEQMEPNSEQTHLLLGDSYRQRKLFDNARTEYRKALEIQPNDPAALLGLASADFGVGDSGDAVKTARAALDQRPSDPELNLLMGEVLVEQHSFAQAEPYLNRSLAAKPQMVTRVHALLGRVYEETGRTTQALEQLRLGLPSDTDGTVHYQLARVYRQMGDEKDASVALTEMKELQQHRRQTASLAMEDSHAPELDDRDGGPER